MSKNKLKVLAVSISYPPYTSGVATVAASLTGAMQERGHFVGVITSSPQKRFNVGINKGIREYRLESLENPFRKNYFVPVPQPGILQKIFREFEPDLVHLHDISPTSLGILNLAKNKVPVLYTHHFIPRFVGRQFVGESDFYIKSLMIKSLEKTLAGYIKFFANKCDYMTTPTATIKKYLREYGVTTRILPVSNGIDGTKFKPRNYTKKEKIPLILYFGRIDKDKSLEVLIDATPLINTPFKLVIAGRGQEMPKLEACAKKLGTEEKIKFVGFIEEKEKARLFRSASVFAIPSTVEAQSIVTMEALSTGLPVIAANASALPELVHDGVNGYLFEPGNARDLADKITKLITSDKLQKDFGMSSLEIIKDHDIKRTFDIYEKLYYELVKGRYKMPKWELRYGHQ